jgi:predicted amidophosphoribosyltransferase
MKNLIQPYLDLVFPNTCVCCGSSLSQKQRYICVWCRKKRFEDAEDNDQVISPDNVKFVYSMWKFDKGGYLQDLLHNLKYNFLQDVGEELGYLAGKSFIDQSNADLLQFLDGVNPIVIPVPLYKSKMRKRGYNQSRALARGFARVTGWDVSKKGAVKRVKRTKTQTGLNMGQRAENLRGAFKISDPELFNDCFPIIIDDVFTTGATVFELAGAIGAASVGAVTIAKT